ncbi:uncharacterized protein [Palaemon carinicauda]|uniref:uncharacterized protein n=1 Tax=Palaemon carinicauda TaxID=392227 RepID=UPI0035B6A500
MDDGQQHLKSQGFRPRTEFLSQMATPLPAPPLPPSGLHQGNIPYNSSQCHGSSLTLPPPPPPPQALLPSTFQAKGTGESASGQLSFTPSSSFHGHRYPTPDFTRPPPSFCSYDRGTQGMSQGIQQVTNALGTSQDYGSCQTLFTHERYSFPASSESSYNQSPHSVPGEEGWKNSSHSQQSTKTVSTCEEPVNIIKQDDQMWLKKFEQQILERKEEQIDGFTSKKKPLKLIEVQQMVSQSRTLTRRLIQLKENFILMKNEEGQSLWELITQIEKIKVELDGITQKFRDPVFLEDVRRLICQRRKKRIKRKRLHKLKVQERKEQRELVKKEEEKIDAWRERIRQEEEDKRREIAIKTEADTILGEVRQKQTDAVKMQQLLENLISLRIARLNKGAAQGFVATPQQDHLFAITIIIPLYVLYSAVQLSTTYSKVRSYMKEKGNINTASEIAIKTEADTILGEVRQKQTDAVKMQQLLENLISLRIARLNKGAAQGFVATPQQDHLFAITINDILFGGLTQKEHDDRLNRVLRVLQKHNVAIN